jgi:tetratricopeptide (TPR) repeat protein
MNPLRPTLWQRFRAWYRSFPRWLVALVLVVFVGLAVAVAWFGTNRVLKNRHQNAINKQWTRFDKAVHSGAEETDLREALDGVLALDPNNDRARRYLTALETGEADESDTAMCILSMICHLRKGKLDAASREAKKRLAVEPNDWLARCIVAHAALAAENQAEANAAIDLFPDLTKIAPSPLAMLLAHELYQRTGRNPEPFRKFVNNSLVDALGSVSMEKYSAGIKSQLIECYLIGFHQEPGKAQEPRLGLGVTPALKLLDQAFQQASADQDAAQLTRLGSAANRLLEAFQLLFRDKQMSAEQHAGLSHEHEARIKKIWEAVRERDPKQPAAYHGLALGHSRAGRLSEAREILVAGIRECGDNPQLLALYSHILIQEDKAEEATKLMLAAAQKEPENLMLCLLTAETALVAGQRHITIAACQQARRISPNHPLALRIEAEVHIAVGNSHEAVQLLSQLGEAQLVKEPKLSRAYVRSQVSAGLGVTVPAFLTAVEDSASKTGTPTAAAHALAGLFDSPYDPNLAETAQAMVERLMTRWPTHPDVLLVRALLLVQVAQEGTPPWEVDRTQAAANALDRVQAVQKNHPDLAAYLAWVHLKGQKKPDLALTATEVLSTLEQRGEPLNANQLTVLGAVYLANGKVEPAIQMLERAKKSVHAPASTFIHLALAYHAQGRHPLAKETLAVAREKLKSTQDQSDYSSAQSLISRESS